jgi:hypothetical protein
MSTHKKNSHRVDLQEFAPQRFLIHNPGIKQIIKGEGVINGKLFELTTWRRDGLLARLQMQGFRVLTLQDQVESLPALPAPEPIGEDCPRTLSTRERFSFFNPLTLTWAAVEPSDPDESDGQRVLLRSGWIVRRRRGRGAPGYYRVLRERSGDAGLAPLSETDALLMGYAQAARHPRSPLTVQRTEGLYWLPDLVLPAPWQELLQRLGQHARGKGWQIDEHTWPLARRLYERLGLRLKLVEKD